VRWRRSTAGGGNTATRVLLVVEEGGGKDDEGGDVERGEYGRCNTATSKTSGGGLLSATTRISRSRLLGIEGGGATSKGAQEHRVEDDWRQRQADAGTCDESCEPHPCACVFN
jgi:hypothetical protein